MSIESILKLDDQQLALLAQWRSSLPARSTSEEDEDVCLSGPEYNLTYYDTGIGPVIIVWTNIDDEEYSIHLEYDDDGVLVGTYNE